MKMYQGNVVNPETGKRPLVYDIGEALTPVPVLIPCGHCIGCRMEKSKAWAVRCVHEAQLHEPPDGNGNCFITLTFDDKFLDEKGSLVKRDFVLFMKRLRKFVCNHVWDEVTYSYVSVYPPKDSSGVRFFHCGEYGSQGNRPHHHACIFNYRFGDMELLTIREGVKLYTSKTLEELWPYGYCTVGDVTVQSAAYIARYVLKKQYFDKRRPELIGAYYNGREPEYITMSRKGGIGTEFYKKFKSDMFPHGFAVLGGGIKVRTPEFYERKFELDSPEDFHRMKVSRIQRSCNNPDNTPKRLSVREDIQYLRAKKLVRGLEQC